MCSSSDLLTALVELALDDPGPSPALLAGELLDTTLRLHVIPLDETDPIGDLSHLVAPAEWELIVARCTAVVRDDRGASTDVTLVHGLDRSGHTVTRIRDGPSCRVLHAPVGPLQSACEQVLAEVAPRRSMLHGRS